MESHLSQGELLFTDSAYFDGRSCLPGIAPDIWGLLQAWFMKDSTDSPYQAEAKALLLATSPAIENGWSNLLSLSDTLVLVDSTKSSNDWSFDVANIICDIKCHLARVTCRN